MSAALSFDLVEIPCSLVFAGREKLTFTVRGRVVVLDRRLVSDFDASRMVVDQTTAAEIAAPALVDGLTDTDLARRFAKSVDWIYRNIAELVAEEGFPKPVTRLGHRRYNRAEVDAWFARDRGVSAMTLGQDRTEAVARRHPARPVSEPLEHGEAAFGEEAEAWRAALADQYGSSDR